VGAIVRISASTRAEHVTLTPDGAVAKRALKGCLPRTAFRRDGSAETREGNIEAIRKILDGENVDLVDDRTST